MMKNMDTEEIVDRIVDGLAQDYLDAAYGANRTINGLTFGGLDYLGDKLGFDSRMNEYLELLPPHEQMKRRGLGNAAEWGGRLLGGYGLGSMGLNALRTPFNAWQIGRAYDRLSENPYQGAGQDVIARMKNHNGETVLLQRGEAIPGANGEVITSGKDLFRETGSRSNYGLNKAIYKHNVPRGEATEIPGYIKRTPVESSPYGQNVYEISRPDGKYRVITSTTPNGQTISSMYKIDR